MRSVALLLLLAAPAALAQPEPGWGFTWERVGDRPIDANDLSFGPDGTLWSVRDSTRWLDVSGGFPGRWRAVPHGPSGGDAVLQTGGDTLIVVSGRTRRSTNRGVLFNVVAEFGAYVLYDAPSGTAIAGRLLEGTEQTASGAAYSEDRGATWTLAAFTVPQSIHLLYAFAAVPLADVPPGLPARVVAGGDGGIYLSDDGGANWRNGPATVFSYPTLRGEFVLALPRPGGGTRLLAVFDVAMDPSIATATSDDGGQTWVMGPGLDEPSGDGLGWPNVNGLDPIGGSSALAVLGRGRIHRTDDAGLTWFEVGQAPRETETTTTGAAAIGPDGRLYVSMNAIGPPQAWVFRTAEVVVAREPLPDPDPTQSWLDVRPNPGQGPFAVSYSQPRTSFVRVAVYDVLGREIGVLYHGPLPEGAHRMQWETTAVEPGAYVIRVVGPALWLSRKVTVWR